MAGSTEILPGSCSSSSSAQNHNHRYDVFLSFRGADTRNGFTDHLYNALLDAGIINTFLDDEEIETGEPLKPELESAIKSSRASIIVLSKNYASSTWCLDELVLILEQQENFKQIVIPVFYDVKPTNVRKQQSSFREAMEKHKQRMEEETDAEKKSQLAEKMESWKKALTQVADLKGKDANNRKHMEVIEEVVVDIRGRLGVLLSSTLPHLIGMDHQIKSISSWLSDESCHSVDILTIVGMSGIGKTSLARYVFELHSHKFHKSSFIVDINTKCKENCNVLLDLQKQLHEGISIKIQLQVNDVHVYTSILENALARKRVFIVLDDIGSLDQLDALLGNKGLHLGSKVIVTTKDASLTERCALFDMQFQPKHTPVLLKGLWEYDSLKLLCIHAFKSQMPKEGYKEVSEKLAKYCDGHPLALKVMGKSLQEQKVAYWEDYIKVLKKEPLTGIEKAKEALKMSIESLPSENDKELFKHIACFFVGMDRDLTETILNACDINTIYGITHLIDRCLLSITHNRLMMHQLVQEMGRDLVRKESPNKPWERSRVWCHEDSFKVLEQNEGTENVLGLTLDLRMLEKEKLCGSLQLKTDALSKMNKLKLLQLNYVKTSGSYKNISKELRWLCIHGFQFKSIPKDLPMKNLVALDMSHSNIESFGMSYSCSQHFMSGLKRLIGSSSKDRPSTKTQKVTGSCSKDKKLLGSLKILDLSFCEQLRSLGGFGELPALERLIVRKCISLIEVCESVEQCVDLVHIDMSYCYKLKRAPTFIGKLKKLKTLLLDGCIHHKSQIEIRGTNSSDMSINSQTSSSAIPCDLKFVTIFLPSLLITLSLANNNLSNESFPMDFSSLSMLKELDLTGNPIVSMPSCVRALPRLQILNMYACKMLISVEYPSRTLRSLLVDISQKSLRKIKFHREISPLWLTSGLASRNYPLEIDGVVNIEAMASVEEKILHSLGWTNLDFIKEKRLTTKVHGRELTECQTQMYYEFGIFSTFYEGEQMPDWIECRSKGSSISFIIPSSPNHLRGLNFCYTLDKIEFLPDIKISNNTKNHTWSYSHYIYTAEIDGKGCLVLLSHWMFGPNEMKADDHITIEVIYRRSSKQITKECGVGLVYEDEETEEEEEDVLGYYKSWNHIIGGDLSAFRSQTRTIVYYLNHAMIWGTLRRRLGDSPFLSLIDNYAGNKGRCHVY